MAEKPKSIHGNGLTRLLVRVILVLMVFFIHQPTGLNSICPVGYLFPDCSQLCPPGFYGLNCSSTCPGTCYNFSCRATDGNCFRCRPGLSGPTCSDRCAAGRFGEDCAQKCSLNCVQETCSPFTGFCLRCLDGFTGKRCRFPAHRDDLEAARKREADAEESRSKDDEVVMISLTIVGLLIIPACIILVVVPWVRKKIRKKRMRSRREAFLRKQLSEAMSERKFSPRDSTANDPFQGHLFASASEIFSGNPPIMSRLRRGLSERLAGRRGRVVGRRKHSPIYNPTRSRGHKGESPRMATPSSLDFVSLRKSMKKTDFLQKKHIKRLVSRRDNPIVLTTTPGHVSRHPETNSQDPKLVSEEDVDAKAHGRLDLVGASVKDRPQLFFKTMPSEGPEIPKSVPQTKSKERRTEKGADQQAVTSVRSSTRLRKGEDSPVAMGSRDRGEETSGKVAKAAYNRLSTSSVQKLADSGDSKTDSNTRSSVKGLNSLQGNQSQAKILKKHQPRKLQSDWSIMSYPNSCTLAVAMDQSALSPYQSTTHPITTRCIRSPYSVLTHVHSVAGFGKIVNAIMGYFQRPRYAQRPRASLAIKSLDECRTDNSERGDWHSKSGNTPSHYQDVKQKVHREKEEDEEKSPSISHKSGPGAGRDTTNRYHYRIRKSSSHPNTPNANCRRELNISTTSNIVKVVRSPEKEAEVKGSLSGPKVNSEANFWQPQPGWVRGTSGKINEEGLDCVLAQEWNSTSNKGEIYELCSDNGKVSKPFRATTTINPMSLGFEAPQPSSDMILTFHSQFSHGQQTSHGSGMEEFYHTTLSNYNPSHDNGTIGRLPDGNPDREARHIMLPEKPLQGHTLARPLPFQRKIDTFFNQYDEFASQKTNECQQPIKQTIWETANVKRHMESQIYQTSDGFFLSNESMENISESSDVLSINCNQPIITRTGRHTYQVRREEGLSLKNRFPEFFQKDDLPPWEMPCNQTMVPGVKVPEAQHHSSIPPINTGTGAFGFASVERTAKASENDGDSEPPTIAPKLASPLPKDQPLIHFSKEPSSVKATDFYLGKAPEIQKRAALTIVDTFQDIKYKEKKGKKDTTLHRPSKSTLARSTQASPESHAKRTDGVRGDSASYAGRDVPTSNKNTQHVGESASGLESPHLFGKRSSKQPHEQPKKNLPKSDHPPETKDIISDLGETCASLEKRPAKNQKRHSAESRQSGDSSWTDPMATSVCDKQSFHKAPEHGNETLCPSIPESKTVQRGSAAQIIENQSCISQEDSLHPSRPSDDNAMAPAIVGRAHSSALWGNDGSSREDTRNDSPQIFSEESHGMVANTVKNSMDQGKETDTRILVRPEPERPKSRELSDEIGYTNDASKKLTEYDISRKESDIFQNTGSELTTNLSCGSILKLGKAQNEVLGLMQGAMSIQESQGHPRDDINSLQLSNFNYPTPSLLETWFSSGHLLRKSNVSLLNMGSSSESDLAAEIQKITDCNLETSTGSTGHGGRSTCMSNDRKQSYASSLLDEGKSVDEETSHRGQGEEELMDGDEPGKDESDSEEYQDALSVRSCRSFRTRFGTADQVIKTSNDRAPVTGSTSMSSSAESLYKTVDSMEDDWVNNKKEPFPLGNSRGDAVGSCPTNAVDVGNPEEGPKMRMQEDGSTFSQASCEHETYTVKSKESACPSVEGDLAQEGEKVDSLTVHRASSYQQSIFGQSRRNSTNAKQGETDVKLEQKERRSQLRTKGQRQKHSENAESALNSSSNIKVSKTIKTSSNERKGDENKNQKRQPEREQLSTEMRSLHRKKNKRLSDSSQNHRLRYNESIDSLSRQASASSERNASGQHCRKDNKTPVSRSHGLDVKKGRESSLTSVERHKKVRDKYTFKKRAQSEGGIQSKGVEHTGNRVLLSARELPETDKFKRWASPSPRLDLKYGHRRCLTAPTHPVQRAISETRHARRQSLESLPDSIRSSHPGRKTHASEWNSRDKCVAFFKNTNKNERPSSSRLMSFTEFFYDVTDK